MEKTNTQHLLQNPLQDLLEWLRTMSYSEDQVSKHRQFVNKLAKYMEQNSINKYSKEVGDIFLEEYFSKKAYSNVHKKRVKMIVYRLNGCIEGKIPTQHRAPSANHFELPDSYVVLLKEYLDWCDLCGQKASTIKSKSQFCERFFAYLIHLGCNDIEQITPSYVTKAYIMFSNKNAWSHIRTLLKYLYDKCFLSKDYSLVVPHYRRPNVVPSVYTEDEIKKLETVFRCTGKSGIRDYAMFLLASRYGLRIGDIVKLTMQELDFEQNRISLIQEKTAQPWTAKLLPEVRAVLLEYICNVRPESDLDTVFLLNRAPYHGVNKSSLSYKIRKYLSDVGIDNKNRKQGSHALRSSLASSMINDDVPYEVVCKVLGHSNPNSIKHYAKLDIERLRKYAIPVPKPTGIFAQFLCGEVQI